MIKFAHATAWANSLKVCLAGIFMIASLSACSTTSPKQLTFNNPPSVGQTLPNGQRFFACQSKGGARYMASTGFMISGCQQLHPHSADRYRVHDIQKIDLPEGEMWQIQLKGPKGLIWMPLPWHDWA